MDKLRNDHKNIALRRQIRDKRKSLKDLYYHEKALAINSAAEAKHVEKEFQLAKTAIHKPSSKIDIAKDKLTKHLKEHFSDRVLKLPPEIEHPESFEYLKDIPIKVNEEPPNIDEIRERTKTFKNNKSSVTDNLPPEGTNK